MSGRDNLVTEVDEPDGGVNASNGTTPNTTQQEAGLPEALQQSRQSDVPTALNAPNTTRDNGNPEQHGPIVTKGPHGEHYVQETGVQSPPYDIPRYPGNMGFNPHLPNFVSKNFTQPPNWQQQQWMNQSPPWAMHQPMYPPHQWMPQHEWSNQPPPWAMPQMPMQQYAPQSAFAVTRSQSTRTNPRWTNNDRANRDRAANAPTRTPVNIDPTFATPQSRRRTPEDENTVPIAGQAAGGGPSATSQSSYTRSGDVRQDLRNASASRPNDNPGDDDGEDDDNGDGGDDDNNENNHDRDEGGVNRRSPSGSGNGGPPDGDPGSDHNDDDESADNRSELPETTRTNPRSLSPSHNRDNIPIPTTIMQVKSVDMNMTQLDPKSIETFQFRAIIACKDHPNFNPAVWISKSVLDKLLAQAKEDIIEKAKLSNGSPNYAEYPRINAQQLYEKIGERNANGDPIGVDYIVKIMTRSIVDTKNLFQNCLKEFSSIECRGKTQTHVRGMHTKVVSTFKSWTESMHYDISLSLGRSIIKSLNSKLQGKLMDSGFWRTFTENKAICNSQMNDADKKTNSDNDVMLWVAVLDFTLNTFEKQIEFAEGPGVPAKQSHGSKSRPASSDRLAAIAPERGKSSSTKKTSSKSPDTMSVIDEKHMTCFMCGKKGVRTGHENCKCKDEPNAAGAKAKAAYREKLAEKKKKSRTLQAMEPDSDSESEPDMSETSTASDSDIADDMCMFSAWDNDVNSDSSDDDKVPELMGAVGRNTDQSKYNKPDSPPVPILTPGENKLAIFQDVVINSKEATVMFDTGALGRNGNWISEETATRLGAFIEKTKKKSWKSPLFPDATYVTKTKTSLSILFKNFGFEIQAIEFRIMDSSALKAEIILGLEFIEQYEIMSYLTDPSNYHAVQTPPPAEEEAIDWDEGIFAFQSAILDLSGHEKSPTRDTDHDYRSGINVNPDFPSYERACKILEKYHGTVLTTSLNESTINCPPMNIQPIKPFPGCKPRRMNEAKKAFLDKWLDKKLKAGIIEPCRGNANDTSMPTSPLVLVEKPPPATDPYRVTLDAQEVNKCFPSIRIESPITRECLQRLGGNKWYWKADMVDYFFQFKVTEEMANMYAFSTHRGIYRFKGILPQGDKNSQAWTCNAMGHILNPLQNEVANYVDDFGGGDDNPDALCDKLERFLELMKKANAKFSPAKMIVGFPSVDFVGFVVNKTGYKPKVNQLEKFANAPFPTREKLRSWFGLLNVFRDFIPNLHKIDAAFKEVRKKNAPWTITEEMKIAFEEAKKAVANITCLHFPLEKKNIYLDADASDKGCGAILYHLEDDEVTKLPIRFMSHVFTDAAIKWSTIQKECWALVKAFNTFEFFLFGKEFHVKTDHRNLLYMQRSCNAKVQRWFGYLMLFDFIIEHIPGVKNVVADALSRVFAFMAQLDPDEEKDDDAASKAQTLENALEILQQESTDTAWTVEKLQELFDRFHNGVTGHLSLSNTLSAMKRENCDAPHLKQHVIRMLAKCAPCQKARKDRVKPVLEYHTTSSFKPFETVQADFLTGIGKSALGYNCILVFTCTFTRYTMLYACVDQTAPSVANNLLHLWGIFGNIRQLTSDGASSFTSKLVGDVCKLLRIKQVITSAHNPGSHGIVENRNREISKIARKVYLDIANASEKNWEIHLPLVQRILNAQNNISTGYSPYHLVFGTMVTQDLKALENPAFDIATITDPHKFVRDLDNSLNIVFKSGLTSVEDRVMHNYLRQSESTVSFKTGDYVLLPNHRSRAQALGKFAPQLIGPMKVIKTFGNDFYELRDLVQDEPVFAHGCDLHIFECDSEQQALSVAAADYGELIIQSVVSHNGNPDKLGKLFFTVTFTDDPSVTTTLPYKEVKYVQLVRNYINEHKDVLRTAAADLRKQETVTPTKRVKRISQALEGFEH